MLTSSGEEGRPGAFKVYNNAEWAVETFSRGTAWHARLFGFGHCVSHRAHRNGIATVPYGPFGSKNSIRCLRLCALHLHVPHLPATLPQYRSIVLEFQRCPCAHLLLLSSFHLIAVMDGLGYLAVTVCEHRIASIEIGDDVESENKSLRQNRRNACVYINCCCRFCGRSALLSRRLGAITI